MDRVEELHAPAPGQPLRRKVVASLRAAAEAIDAQLRRLDPPRKPRPGRPAAQTTLADRVAGRRTPQE